MWKYKGFRYEDFRYEVSATSRDVKGRVAHTFRCDFRCDNIVKGLEVARSNWDAPRVAHTFRCDNMMKSFESELFSMRVVIYPTSYLWVIGSILLVLLLSETPAIRRVYKLDLAEATKIIE